jgi:hypothetical protein
MKTTALLAALLLTACGHDKGGETDDTQTGDTTPEDSGSTTPTIPEIPGIIANVATDSVSVVVEVLSDGRIVWDRNGQLVANGKDIGLLGTNAMGGLAVDGDSIYASPLVGGEVDKFDVATGTSTTLLPSGTVTRGTGIAVLDDGRIWLDGTDLCAVFDITDGTADAVAVGTSRSCGYTGDGGPATAAEINPHDSNASDGLKTSSFGQFAWNGDKLLFVDSGNQVIRSIDPASGQIDLFAGQFVVQPGTADGTPGFDYTEDVAVGAARFAYPRDVAVCGGAVYVTDGANHCIRRIQDGTIDTVAGTCTTSGDNADGVAGTDALLNTPEGIACLPSGAIVWTESANGVIRKLLPLPR